MLERCPVSTPMDRSVKLLPYHGNAISHLSYSKMIRSLMYVMTLTRPDIAYAIGKLSTYTSHPGSSHWIAIRRALRYLKGTISHGLCYSGEPSVLEGYLDASWITNKEDSSSTSGWVFMYGGGAISWFSNKQTRVSDSTTTSEFIGLASESQKAEWP